LSQQFNFAKNSVKAQLRVAARKIAKMTGARYPMFYPTYSAEIAASIERYSDDIRYASIALAIQRLEQEGVKGPFAELGVYRGVTSAFIHRLAPERRLYLFDTFAGFPEQALEAGTDERFKDASQEIVSKTIGDTANVEFRAGYFPETAAGLEDERFAFVMLDFDLYRPALDALRFFYPRLVRGAYFFMHDFNSPESNHAISRAALEFLADKPELVIEIPDQAGSAMFRKTT
jgi:O-methyltransferase